MSPLQQKKLRAEKVMNKLTETFKSYSESDDIKYIQAGKKTSRLITNAVKKLEEELDDKEYIKKVTELSGKLFTKLDDLESSDLGTFLKDDLNWMNEIKFIVLFDIDDTVRFAEHRLHIRDEIINIQEQRKEVEKGSDLFNTMSERIDNLWDDFFVAGLQDEPRKDMISLCNKYYDLGFEVKFRTGATAKYQKETHDYLTSNGAKFHELRMRKIGVRIPDHVLKPAWIPKYDGAENVFASYDDREPVNAKYAGKGVVDVILVTKDFDVEKHLNEFKDKIEKALVFIKKEPEELANKRKKKLKM